MTPVEERVTSTVWLDDLPGHGDLRPGDRMFSAVGPGVHGHRLRDGPGTAVLAVRPDGHLGHRGTDPARLRDWLGG
jgi:hypothetical protein